VKIGRQIAEIRAFFGGHQTVFSQTELDIGLPDYRQSLIIDLCRYIVCLDTHLKLLYLLTDSAMPIA
jgi:hypothetical protein